LFLIKYILMDTANLQIQFEYSSAQTMPQMCIGKPVETNHGINMDQKMLFQHDTMNLQNTMLFQL
jgi:hypothetical protein